MIDWITALVLCRHPIPIDGGRVLRVDPDGTVTEEWPRNRIVEGSYSSRITVRTQDNHYGEPTHLRISGNPAKWFQGHNLFGTDDLIGLVAETMHALVSMLGLTPTPHDRASWGAGAFTLSRVDLTHSFALPSIADVRGWIRAAEFRAKTRHGRGSMSGGTLYYGKHSRRWALKFYSKGDEISAKGHQLPLDLAPTSLADWAQDKLRAELVLRGLELKKHGLHIGANWAEVDTNDLYNRYLSKLQMADQMALTPEQLNGLSPRIQLAYLSWEAGHDLRKTLPRKTFYRYRSELLKHGIDLAIVQGEGRPDTSNVVPLVRYLEAVPAPIPEWAYGTPLLFEPRQNIR